MVDPREPATVAGAVGPRVAVPGGGWLEQLSLHEQIDRAQQQPQQQQAALRARSSSATAPAGGWCPGRALPGRRPSSPGTRPSAAGRRGQGTMAEQVPGCGVDQRRWGPARGRRSSRRSCGRRRDDLASDQVLQLGDDPVGVGVLWLSIRAKVYHPARWVAHLDQPRPHLGGWGAMVMARVASHIASGPARQRPAPVGPPQPSRPIGVPS